MYLTKFIAIIFYLFNPTFSQSPKDIHNAYSLHPVQINDFYANRNNINVHSNVQAKPSTNSEDVNIEGTIEEVQQLIKSNPKLPRLTRGEIIDIIENITKTDAGVLKTRDEGKRALMVVMPFTAGSAQGDDIKELYTRTPVTHMIGGQPQQVRKEPKKNRRRPAFPPVELPEEDIANLHKLPLQSSTAPTTRQAKITGFKSTTIPDLSTLQTSRSTTPLPLRTSPSTTQQPAIQFRPKPVKVTSKPQRKYPNHKYPDDSSSSNISQGGMHIINPPQFSPIQNQYSAPFTMSMSKLRPITETSKPSTSERNIIDDIPIPESYRHVVKDLNLLIDPDTGDNEKDQIQIFTTEKSMTSKRSHVESTKMPDISNVADSLSPDMKDLLMNFGLLEDPNRKPVEVSSTESLPYKQKAEISPDSYLTFKPLPDTVASRNEMEEFFARFGLGRSSFRSQKSIAVNKPNREFGKNSEINMDVIPESMKHVMKDIGFKTDIEKVQSLNQISDYPKHVFNPSIQNATEEELEKLNKLIDMIKDLEKLNGTLTEDNLKGIDVDSLRELIGDFNGQKFVPLNEQDAPNPLNYDTAGGRNGVKRQENTTTTSTTPTTSTTESERAAAPSLLDLEASFGNQSDVIVTTTTEPTTTTPRTGFYFLFDWNTFLDMDNQLGRRVNLRFQPLAGDPRRFRTVTVP